MNIHSMILLIPFTGTNGQDLCLDMTVTDPPPHIKVKNNTV